MTRSAASKSTSTASGFPRISGPPSDPDDLARNIRHRAQSLGFDRVGFCDATPPPEAARFESWLAQGHHGLMDWMERARDRRLDPARVLPGVRSIVAVAIAYARPGPAGDETSDRPGPGRGFVARYARGDDYHRVAGDRLASLERHIEEIAPGHRALAYVDTGPILERLWAARAGLGWVGKNALVLNKEMGSYFFLGIVLTTLALPADAPALDQCGSCRLCVEACPTGAIVEDRVVDSRRCIAYHTIELRGPIPPEHRETIGSRLFGCDDCQEACPWNRQEPDGGATEAFPPRDTQAPSLLEILSMSHEGYLQRFRGSAVKRATWIGLRRNAALCLSGETEADSPRTGRVIEELSAIAGNAGEDPALREQAAWSLERLARR